MLGYTNKISSLEEKATAQVAINLCQQNGFKEVALCLEKPTYGALIDLDETSIIEKDPEKLLSIWDKVKGNVQSFEFLMRPGYLNETKKVKRWETDVDEQCQRLTQEMPYHLSQNIHPWINRIALEYLSYSRRQEVLFGISRYFLMNFITRGDWKETARLDEQKLAQRLLEDERLTVLQRYRIACVYCLHVYIPQLWEKLTQEEKRFTSGDGKCRISEETHELVLLWSRNMNANQGEKVAWPKTGKDLNTFLLSLVSNALIYGNCAALMVCWNEFQNVIPQNIHKEMAIFSACQSLRQWQRMEEFHVKMSLVSHQSPEKQSAYSMGDFNLPSYYSELMFFLLSQTDEEQQLTFLKRAFQSEYCDQSENYKSILECFLDWPHQDAFLPTINLLWGIIPKDKYRRCLLALASKYSKNDKIANRDYDYRSLLRALWEETPEEYKQYVFHDKNSNYSVFCNRYTYYSVINEGEGLLSRLLERSPFQEKDEALFKRIFHDQSQEKRTIMLSTEGEKVCSLLMQKEKWSFLNLLLEECLSKEEIPDFKKRFIHSTCGVKLCLDALRENCENLVEDLLDWSLESDAEKMQHKEKLIENDDCLDVCKSLLRQGKLADLESVINFCLSSDEKKEQCKVHFAHCACSNLLGDYTYDSSSEDCVWEQMDRIIAWSIDTEEKIRDFKKDLFSLKGIDMHYRLVVVQALQGKIKRFYQWFGLSLEEINQLKRDTLFTYRFIKYIHKNLLEYTTNKLVDTLCLCLTDEKMVIDLKKEVEKSFTYVSDERKEMKKEQLDHLVSELLDGFSKEEVLDKTGREGIFVKYTGEKRSVEIDIESSSSSKRRK